ncbi:hypothetical protein [Streptomyces sp. NPDC054865]
MSDAAPSALADAVVAGGHRSGGLGQGAADVHGLAVGGRRPVDRRQAADLAVYRYLINTGRPWAGSEGAGSLDRFRRRSGGLYSREHQALAIGLATMPRAAAGDRLRKTVVDSEQIARAAVALRSTEAAYPDIVVRVSRVMSFVPE